MVSGTLRTWASLLSLPKDLEKSSDWIAYELGELVNPKSAFLSLSVAQWFHLHVGCQCFQLFPLRKIGREQISWLKSKILAFFLAPVLCYESSVIHCRIPSKISIWVLSLSHLPALAWKDLVTRSAPMFSYGDILSTFSWTTHLVPLFSTQYWFAPERWELKPED